MLGYFQAQNTISTYVLIKESTCSVIASMSVLFQSLVQMMSCGWQLQQHLPVVQGRCTFGPRLSDEEIQRLSQYVVEQAAADWK